MMAFRPARMRWTELRLLIVPGIMTIVGLLIIVLAPRATVEWSWQDIWVGLAFSGVAMAFAAAGYIPPTVGALIQEAIDVAVIINALRAA